ncbi:TPA: hypothetical protein ACX6NV_000576 [Photobacterium damselae]
MAVKVLLAALFFSSAAFANTESDASSVASADGTVLNHNTQMNTMLETEVSYSTFTRDSVVCPTTRFNFALMPNHTKHMRSDSTSITGVMALDIPLDLNGTISRCKQQQKALLALVDLERDLKILAACIKAKEQSINITPDHFPWAEKCLSVKRSMFLK